MHSSRAESKSTWLTVAVESLEGLDGYGRRQRTADRSRYQVQTLTDNDPDASIRRWAYRQRSDKITQDSLFD